MLEIRTRALVLRCFDQRESDRIVHLYTEQLGRVSAVAKGARRSVRRFPGTLEILTVLDIRLADSPRASMLRLDGARVLQPFEGLVGDLGRYAIGCQLLEVLQRVTGEREASPELFGFAVGVLDVLRGERPDRLLALLVLAKLVARLGYRPQLASCSVCGRPVTSGDRGVGFEPRHGGAVCASCHDAGEVFPVSPGLLLALEAGIRTPLRARSRLGLSGEDIGRLELLVDRFFRFHIGLELRSMAFLREILSLRSLDGARTRGDNAPTPARGGPGPRVRRPRDPQAQSPG